MRRRLIDTRHRKLPCPLLALFILTVVFPAPPALAGLAGVVGKSDYVQSRIYEEPEFTDNPLLTEGRGDGASWFQDPDLSAAAMVLDATALVPLDSLALASDALALGSDGALWKATDFRGASPGTEPDSGPPSAGAGQPEPLPVASIVGIGACVVALLVFFGAVARNSTRDKPPPRRSRRARRP